MIRGIEHIGITVEDPDKAELFFKNTFGAEVLHRVVPYGDKSKHIAGDKLSPLQGFPPELAMTSVTMLRLANGPNIEIIGITPSITNQRRNIADAGFNHISLYTDDILAAGEKMRLNGATLFEGPNDNFSHEAGEGNQTWFGMTPFGLLIELIALPSGVETVGETSRWIPES
ncbi:glyoxalase/bleomycin resistance/extradiol dioxygenase family protein [Tatumella sp. TA1]|uniref:glyoxalase/bleomycin resistance/extradiol dioxygenase family protein n=1 Tax=Rosenbergiella collisarenosi TaxID=1544695 RepID=UPI0008F8D289|nr:glyoxalase/bleomycin resistance/extradiol dioxygenase family protein [Rosenbergiella collisarenosi]MBT0720467.1 glyoxalase/bleomycin resistance/extradiol dioxygenase family protein [Rosenbergiella collisarenosi]QGX91896.1 glyoxalase/bleomycin resistance/extradiol dioxygenase family protein [Tatumella sp. TA1]